MRCNLNSSGLGDGQRGIHTGQQHVQTRQASAQVPRGGEVVQKTKCSWGKDLGNLTTTTKINFIAKKENLSQCLQVGFLGFIPTNNQPNKKKEPFAVLLAGLNLASWQVQGLSPEEYPKSPAKKVARKIAVFQRKVHSLSATELTVTTSPSVTSS